MNFHALHLVSRYGRGRRQGVAQRRGSERRPHPLPKTESQRDGPPKGAFSEWKRGHPPLKYPMIYDIDGDADALVTYNVSDFAVAADRFGVSGLRPVDVLKKVKP
jgi:hypothetical protein